MCFLLTEKSEATTAHCLRGRLALGVNWTSFQPFSTPATLWKTNHFNPKKLPTLKNIKEMDKYFDRSDITDTDRIAKMQEIEADSIKCRHFMNSVVDNAIVEIAYVCGLKLNSFGQLRVCINRKEVTKALKDVELRERAAFVQFIAAYILRIH